jgi:hypothetical protein
MLLQQLPKLWPLHLFLWCLWHLRLLHPILLLY